MGESTYIHLDPLQTSWETGKTVCNSNSSSTTEAITKQAKLELQQKAHPCSAPFQAEVNDQ